MLNKELNIDSRPENGMMARKRKNNHEQMAL